MLLDPAETWTTRRSYPILACILVHPGHSGGALGHILPYGALALYVQPSHTI